VNGIRSREGRVWIAALLAAAGALSGCTRYASLPEESDAAVPPLGSGNSPPADLRPVDAGLDGLPACASRPLGQCAGPWADAAAVCAPDSFLSDAIAACWQNLLCVPTGWLRIVLGDDGCVTEFEMDQPNDALIECLVQSLGPIRCPCRGYQFTTILGPDNVCSS
jgi:hypothetical protein